MRLLLKILLPALLSALMLTAGCGSEEARSVAGAVAGGDDGGDDGGENSPDLFTAEITLCRKVSQKTGRPIGAGEDFRITAKSYVNALVDFSGVTVGRTYVVHLVWVAPEGKEIFRKYAEVLPIEDSPGGFRTVVSWLDATDLHKVDRDTLSSEFPGFALDSRLNISDGKDRPTGTYQLLVYLDRRLLLTKEFQVLDETSAEI